jgi:hypothetical protein
LSAQEKHRDEDQGSANSYAVSHGTNPTTGFRDSACETRLSEYGAVAKRSNRRWKFMSNRACTPACEA